MDASENTIAEGWPRALGIAGLLLVVAAGAWLRWAPPETVSDLLPWPDALEYEEGARSLLAGDGYQLAINGKSYPSRYPPGLSLLIAPVFSLIGTAPGGGIWVVFLMALATIVTTWRLGLMLAGVWGGLAAGLLVSLSPLHVAWSQAVMSDVPATAIMSLLCLLAIRAADAGPRSTRWILLGIACGLGPVFRPALMAVVPGILLLVWMGHAGTKDSLAKFMRFLGGLGAAVVGSLALNAILTRTLLLTRYDYWVEATIFDPKYIFAAPQAGGEMPNFFFLISELAGGGRLYPWPIAVLAVLGISLQFRDGGRKRQFAALGVVTIGATVALYSIYFWQSGRFLLPILPIVAVLAGYPLGARIPLQLRVPAIGLFAWGLTLLFQGYPDAFGPPQPALGIGQTLLAIDAEVEDNARIIGHAPHLLVSRTIGPAEDREWIHLGADPHRINLKKMGREGQPHEPGRQIRITRAEWPPKTAPLIRMIQQALDKNQPVYFYDPPGQAFGIRWPRRIRKVIAAHFQLELYLEVAGSRVYRVQNLPDHDS